MFNKNAGGVLSSFTEDDVIAILFEKITRTFLIFFDWCEHLPEIERSWPIADVANWNLAQNKEGEIQ